MKRDKQFLVKGFTLIELIIVIAILAILALIGLPLYSKYLQDARVQQAHTNCVVIGHSIEGYVAKTGDSDPEDSDLMPYLNETAKAILNSGDYDYEVVAGNVQVTGPEGTQYPGE